MSIRFVGDGDPFKGLSAVELNSFVPLARAAAMTSLSEDTLRRRYGHLIVKVSSRRSAIRLRDVLALPGPASPASIPI
jgi:hypothetical protein